MNVIPFYHSPSGSFSYIVTNRHSHRCLVIDPVLDFEAQPARTSTESADQIISYITRNGLELEWILETHAHADHLSAAQHLKQQCGGKVAIGRQITQVQRVFGSLFNEGTALTADGSQFDLLLDNDDRLQCGDLEIRVLHTPGHTPACISYQIGEALFVGDTLFMPDLGTARADFPGGDAGILFQSIQKLLNFPDHYRIYVCHDYPPEGREATCSATVAEQRSANIHLNGDCDSYIALRQQRDATLAIPALLFPAIQVNIRAGKLPEAESNGIKYLKIPLNQEL
ncbi:MBL fold metallo-hydrolase [Marinobacterium jannaschii]|uniref:MBL fold metallo-hydrolase n=1 Tax=Marinobacterium jannaschii TaxID=64970 RepID=UPI0004866077|nr:MBL fold metallo-hydrolase [Marinobacterium jannaschii]